MEGLDERLPKSEAPDPKAGARWLPENWIDAREVRDETAASWIL